MAVETADSIDSEMADDDVDVANDVSGGVTFSSDSIEMSVTWDQCLNQGQRFSTQTTLRPYFSIFFPRLSSFKQ